MRLCALGHKGKINKESCLKSYLIPWSAGACVVSINLPTGVSQLMVSEVILTIEMQNKHTDIGIT